MDASAETVRTIRRSAALVGLVMMLVGFSRCGCVGGDVVGPDWALALASTGVAIPGIVSAIEAYIRRHVSHAVLAGCGLFIAFTISITKDADRTSWLVGLGMFFLVVLVGGVLPLAIGLWRSTRDERERAIVGASSALAFLITMLLVVGFLVAQRYADVGSVMLTPSWVLLTGAVSWVVALLVLRERM